jgi:hypothetical protein
VVGFKGAVPKVVNENPSLVRMDRLCCQFAVILYAGFAAFDYALGPWA